MSSDDGGPGDSTRRGLLARSAALAVTGGLAGCSSGTNDGGTTGAGTDGGETSSTTAGAAATEETGTGTTDSESTAATEAAAENATAADDSASRNETATGTTTTAGPTVVELGATVQGWRGRQPESLRGQTNPTFRMRPGETYEIRWLNLDGQPHQFVLVDPEGTALDTSEPAREKGATRVLRVEATERMASYRCKFHPQAMQGSVLTGPPGTSGREETPRNGTEAGNESTNQTAFDTGATSY
ncbi:hypothetical protein ACFO0N_04775 [Halobium salinum]|uniref:Blue (type 1) copper domain-containing protein n=1 Tax=Halobium salinum TaxID=1364940 RepID=A0ABD5P8P7_9EURY|nr:hypothetical protein [Halobium salinum]